MIVVANGGYRTGSTLAYAILRELMPQAEDRYSMHHLDILKLDTTKDIIIKSHNFIPPENTQIKTVYTRRIYLDVFASFVDFGDHGLNIVDEVAEENKRRKLMLYRPHLCLDYEDFFENEIYAVRKISEYLGIECDAESIANKVSINKIKEKTDIDEHAGIFHKNHVDKDSRPYCFIDYFDHSKLRDLVYKVREKTKEREKMEHY